MGEVGRREFGRLPIEVVDRIPTPEEVFGIRRLDTRSLVLKVLGPSVIALGVAIGGGEWLLGPATAVRYGLGMMWIVLVSALLQTVYNVAVARLIIYSGEAPIVYLRRAPPGPRFWSVAIPVMIIAWGGLGPCRDRGLWGYGPGLYGSGEAADG